MLYWNLLQKRCFRLTLTQFEWNWLPFGYVMLNHLNLKRLLFLKMLFGLKGESFPLNTLQIFPLKNYLTKIWFWMGEGSKTTNKNYQNHGNLSHTIQIFVLMHFIKFWKVHGSARIEVPIILKYSLHEIIPSVSRCSILLGLTFVEIKKNLLQK